MHATEITLQAPWFLLLLADVDKLSLSDQCIRMTFLSHLFKMFIRVGELFKTLVFVWLFAHIFNIN
jgi:hypothetical protein